MREYTTYAEGGFCMPKRLDLTGKRFGKLVAIEVDEQRAKESKKRRYWKCICDCGNISSVGADKLTNGFTKSCGCMMGHKTHNMSGTRPHNIWMSMRNRCKNSNTKDSGYYVEKGITYCEKWSSFDGFWEDMQEGYADDLTLDRIDSNGNYEKSNCRWATRAEQSRNRSFCRYLTFNGETKTLAEFCRQYGLNKTTVLKKVRLGWDATKILAEFSKKIN